MDYTEVIIFLFLLLLVTSTTLWSKDWRSVPEYDAPHSCFKDLLKFCNGKSPPTLNNKFECLSQNLDKVSPNCQRYLDRQLSAPCVVEIQKYCPIADKNKISCLRNHNLFLSPKCKTWVKTQDFIDSCSGDRKKLCQDEQNQKKANLCMELLHSKKKTSKSCQEATDRYFEK